MWLKHLWNRFLGQPATRRGPRSGAKRLCRRLSVEQLEGRDCPASPTSPTAATVGDLIADINAANLAGGSNTIILEAGATFTLSAAYSYGNGLPAIAANDNLTIIGNNDTIQRKAKDTTSFRLFDVSPGASLTLANLTLQGGLSRGGDGTRGAGGGAGAGGGIYVEGSTTDPSGVSVPGGTANLTNVTLIGNTAQGGNGSNDQVIRINRLSGSPIIVGPGAGGDGLGGGIYVGAGASLTMHLCSLSGNTANGGSGGTYKGTHASDGVGEGGGLYLDAGAVVGIDAATLAQISHNHASTSNPDIYGAYTIIT
jgi:hypothetical protein